jgi:hypothetical protein
MIRFMFPILSFALLVAFIYFALRKSTKAKPDVDRGTEEPPRINQGGPQ